MNEANVRTLIDDQGNAAIRWHAPLLTPRDSAGMGLNGTERVFWRTYIVVPCFARRVLGVSLALLACLSVFATHVFCVPRFLLPMICNIVHLSCSLGAICTSRSTYMQYSALQSTHCQAYLHQCGGGSPAPFRCLSTNLIPIYREWYSFLEKMRFLPLPSQ